MIIRGLFSLVLIAGLGDSPLPVASVVSIDRVECLAGAGIRISLEVQISNPSQEPLSLGRVSVARERFYRSDAKGKLTVIDTSHGPDIEVGEDPFDSTNSIKEERLAPGGIKRFTFNHIIYLMRQEVLHGARQEILVSFDIANIEKSGHVSEYWSTPVSISIPKDCRLP